MLKKDKLFPKEVEYKRKFGLRIFNIGGRIKKDKPDKTGNQTAKK
jgi:hypothetical protein